MNKKKPQQNTQEQDSVEFPKFLDIESKVFTQIGKDIYIGRDRIDSTLRSVLRDEAKNLQTTRLWEILNASITNEAYNLALIQSKDFDEVTSAKMLKHWVFFMINVLHQLSKE